ncbi:phosphatase PAP2 family protein [Paractinoplanes durhamensis]|uniref:phosphatase PAP2 family protein n=1 Tax=Paractinoplanes durhamensis TaxID=113563 RepID=UPI0036275EF4
MAAGAVPGAGHVRRAHPLPDQRRRRRPAAAGVEQLDGQMPTSSFPSGHIAATMCLWITIAIIVLARVRHWWRWVFVALAVIMPLGVALSRMYRGMHHPTDVAGAALLTACWLSVLWFTVRPNAHAETATEARDEARALETV